MQKPNQFNALCEEFLNKNFKSANHKLLIDGDLLDDEKGLSYVMVVDDEKHNIGFSIKQSNSSGKEFYEVETSILSEPKMSFDSLGKCFEYLSKLYSK